MSGFGSGLLPGDLLLFWMVTHFSGRVRVNSWDHYRPPVMSLFVEELKTKKTFAKIIHSNSESISSPHYSSFRQMTHLESIASFQMRGQV